MPAIIDAGIQIHTYSGDNDFLLNYWGTELVIQNMTWDRKQGFQGKLEKVFWIEGMEMGEWGYEVCITSLFFLSPKFSFFPFPFSLLPPPFLGLGRFILLPL